MEEGKIETKKLTMSNTKKEMLDAYNAILKKLKEKRETELKPERKIEEKKKRDVVEVAETLSSEGVVKDLGNLKLEMGKVLTQIADGLEGEVNKYKKIQEAIRIKDEELKELYEIERSAESLAALLESQNQKRQEFESEMRFRKEELNNEIQSIRTEWEKRKKDYETETKERDATEMKKREREKEEYGYAFKREQKLAKDKFEDEKAKMEREIQLKKEQTEQIVKLSGQMEKAYEKVEDIAVKAIEGSSNLKSLTNLQQLMTEQARKQSQEK